MFSQEDSTSIPNLQLFDLSLEQLLGVKVEEHSFSLYGYVNSNLEQVYNIPSRDSVNNTISQSSPLEWSPIKNFHLYGSGQLSPKISILFNVAAPSGNFELRNGYGNYLIHNLFEIRVGKMYRKFGLYNEKLDQIPTFTGIEAPELFDTDHLFLPRTTNFMVHGSGSLKDGTLSYALCTGNSEAGPLRNVIPLGYDFRYKSMGRGFILGLSGYTSSITNQSTLPSVGLQQGSTRGGVLQWMEEDHYQVYGAFLEKKFINLLLQVEYWISPHKATRNTSETLRLIQNGVTNDAQRNNFLGDNANKLDSELSEADVTTNVNYVSQTAYIRVGYTIDSRHGQFIPYVFFDWMSNPEMVYNLDWGGDMEVGLADDGQFYKPSIGISYRPIETVAIKLDGSFHVQKFNGVTTTYPEIRLDFSFAFDVFKRFKE